MSTWLYLRCLDHDPPLVAEAESGQHLSDLDDIRADLANREQVVAAWTEHMSNPYTAYTDPPFDHHFRRSTAWFLAAHPTCRVDIRDEYGQVHAVQLDEDIEACETCQAQRGAQ